VAQPVRVLDPFEDAFRVAERRVVVVDEHRPRNRQLKVERRACRVERGHDRIAFLRLEAEEAGCGANVEHGAAGEVMTAGVLVETPPQIPGAGVVSAQREID